MIINDNITLGAKIRVLRALHDFTQVELAKRIGTDQRYIHLFEKDRAVPGDEVRESMEKVFGVQLDSLRIIVSPIKEQTTDPIAVAA